MTAASTTAPAETTTVARRFSAAAYRHPKWRVAGLLSAPLLWLGVLYLGSLLIMLVSSFWSTDDFTGAIVHKFTLNNYKILFTEPVYRTVGVRTIIIAVTVTLIDGLLALPLSFFIAKIVKSRRAKYALVIAVTMPLWTSYLVKGFAWQVVMVKGGALDWALAPLGLHGPGLGLPATVLALSYVWFPYMVLPVYAGFERLPDSLLEASADLGAPAMRTMRSVVLPMIVPALVAGSIFTFSLTLGDYIMVKIVGGGNQMFANIVYDNIGVAGNLPFAAAAAMFPIIVIILYLAAVRRTGALENL